MQKIANLLESKIKLICWDLDGTLLDTEIMWFNMNKIVTEKYGSGLGQEEYNKLSEKIAANAYNTWNYRANADKALNFFKEKGICQVVINKCDLTNKSMLKNNAINKSFSFNNFNEIISELSFNGNFILNDMYKYALKKYKIKNSNEALAICDMPFELKAAKDCGLKTIWAKNINYPFTNLELKEIEENADFYVENFLDLIK